MVICYLCLLVGLFIVCSVVCACMRLRGLLFCLLFALLGSSLFLGRLVFGCLCRCGLMRFVFDCGSVVTGCLIMLF